MLNREAYAKIHILLKERGIDDETYRTILWSTFGVGSSKELSWGQYIRLLEIIKKNFKRVSKSYKTHKKRERKTLDDKISTKQLEYINDLINEDCNILNPVKYIAHCVHREIQSISELTRQEAAIVISILRKRIQ